MKSIFAVGLSVFLLACSSGNNSGGSHSPAAPLATPPSTGLPVTLSSMKWSDALKMKYDSAKIVCNLWTKARGSLSLGNTPNQTVTIDLLQSAELPKDLNLSASSERHSLQMTLHFDSVKLQTGNFMDEEANQYAVTDSPVVAVSLTGKSITTDEQGRIIRSTDDLSDHNTLNENMTQSLVTQAAYDGSPMDVDYLECTLQTEAKAGYQNQWKQTSMGTKAQCAFAVLQQPGQCYVYP